MPKDLESYQFDETLIKFWKKNSNFTFIANYFPAPSKSQITIPNDYLLLRLHILFPKLSGWYATAKMTYAMKFSTHEKALQLEEELNRILREKASPMTAAVDLQVLTLNPVTEKNLVALLKVQRNLAKIQHPDRKTLPTFKK